MLTSLHRLSLMGLMFRNPVELFDRVGRDPCYHGGMIDWIDSLGLKQDDRVLEFGCGPGFLSLELARRGCRVAAVDRSQGMIARLNKVARAQKLDIDARVGDACETGFPSGAFDAVIGASLLNIVKDPSALATEALRLAAPGRKVSFYFPNLAFDRANVRRYIEAKRLKPSSAAILLTWCRVARKLDVSAAHALLRAAGAQDIRSNEHLGGMVGSITGQAACCTET